MATHDSADAQQDLEMKRASALNFGRQVVVIAYMVTLVVSFIPGTLINFKPAFYASRLFIGISMVLIFAHFPTSQTRLNLAAVALFLASQTIAVVVNLRNALSSSCVSNFDPSCPDDAVTGKRMPRRVISVVIDVTMVVLEVNRQAALKRAERNSQADGTEVELATKA
ncbi:hypothetical protein HK105_203169 [Polyrhizophydium stewartii]|uniref:Uncharacterized protein n=1 Tax=Polyrhizophydium stewartii TaxID=2732419 RepID=A0ABR4NC37_9FUNG